MAGKEGTQVKKGAALLDKILPGWYKQVDLKSLRMESGALCMMGQLFGSSVEGKLAKEMYPEEMKEATEKIRKRLGVPTSNVNGYWRAFEGGLVGKLMAKIGLPRESPKGASYFKALDLVCRGGANECEWAAEVADRLLKDDESKGEKTK